MYLLIVISIIILLTTSIALYFRYRNRNTDYLVFSSVGDINNVHHWTADKSKKHFDLVFYYYGDKAVPDFDADILIKKKGLKFENFYHFLENYPTHKYKAIWVADDDIIIDTASINLMFSIFSKYRLWIAQPSFNIDSHAPHAVTRNVPDCILHYTNFVENGVVLLSKEVIPLLKDTFKEARTGFGVDYIWPSILRFPTDKIAVIDSVTCQHAKSDYSALDRVVPRHMHKLQGIELLIKYGLLPEDWVPTDANPWPKPYELKEFSRIAK